MVVGKCSRANCFIVPNEHARSSENIVVRLRFLELFETMSFALSASAATIFPAPRTGTLNVPQLAHVSEASQARDCVGVSRYNAICGVADIIHALCGHPSTR